MAQHENAPAPVERHTGRDCLAETAGVPQLAQLTENRQSQDWSIALSSGDERSVSLTGRPAWLLAHLAEAAAKGLTARDLPAGLRISGFIHRLRLAGVPIETAYETHRGAFPGHHARYRLACRADRIGGDT